MLKFLLLAALLLWLLYSPGVRKLLRGLRGGDAPAQTAQAERPRAADAKRPVSMLPCAHCGVHLPGGDALLNEAGEPFCSEAHRRAGARGN